MPRQQVKSAPSERLRQELEALQGVRRAVIDGPPYRIYLICDPALDGPPTEAAALTALARHGVGPGEVELNLSYLAAPQAPRRVRFEEIRLGRPRVGVVEAVVQLDWGGKSYQGVADGEGGSAGELRSAAQATCRALEEILQGVVTFQVVGTKAIRIFDSDLVSTLLHSPEVPDRRLIGASLVVGDDASRSAALAVLNATNRLLGNYLATVD